MQVHAVPDSERAFDSTGRKLPWAYEFADSDQNQRRIPEERGPFGKPRQRGTSRAKTPTTKSDADKAQSDNLRAIDDIFGRFKQEEEKRRSLSARPNTALPPSASAPNLIDASNGPTTSFGPGASASAAHSREPKEVILYGYGPDAQWAAIAHYEKVSNGIIYEEYDREPYNNKFGYAFASQRASHYRALSKSALRKINEFVGGDHWIKVTFDSAEAAEMACHYSPKSIQGWLVYAEMYRGTPPTIGDVALRAEAGGASQTASPNTVSSGTLMSGTTSTSQSSTTASSATATAAAPASHAAGLSRSITEPAFMRRSGAFPINDYDTPLDQAHIPSSQSQLFNNNNSNTTTNQIPTPQPPSITTATNPRPNRATLRLRNAKPAPFLPPEKAFLPAKPRWQQTFGSWPVLGWIIGSGHGLIGDQVPRKEDGSFDLAGASLYWRLWYMVDGCLGSDFCGVRDAEYDD
ncbi:hypothetical protein LEMA_P039250.1 [Plenodomus lingam JN3]|uniref:Uncharacterized protein n=2 Tax=Leptosphaeria maculans TaxID=5022 RepID=E4ZNG5_LEPMJ|nr:hypothetical protein LEMA_P039250.1 [Plenodomus lingam JN3]CBX93024.1 hypothetical protein LEMA_P039250.1 [Plenodomus lingam JN3]